MAKKIKTILKLQLPAGKATAAPPVGTALGPHGINIGEFVKKFNAETADKGDSIIPKTPPASDLLRKAAGIEKGSGNPLKEKVGKVKKAQIKQIAQTKMEDLNAKDISGAIKIVEGTARSMGIEVE